MLMIIGKIKIEQQQVFLRRIRKMNIKNPNLLEQITRPVIGNGKSRKKKRSEQYHVLPNTILDRNQNGKIFQNRP